VRHSRELVMQYGLTATVSDEGAVAFGVPHPPMSYGTVAEAAEALSLRPVAFREIVDRDVGHSFFSPDGLLNDPRGLIGPFLDGRLKDHEVLQHAVFLLLTWLTGCHYHLGAIADAYSDSMHQYAFFAGIAGADREFVNPRDLDARPSPLVSWLRTAPLQEIYLMGPGGGFIEAAYFEFIAFLIATKRALNSIPQVLGCCAWATQPVGTRYRDMMKTIRAGTSVIPDSCADLLVAEWDDWVEDLFVYRDHVEHYSALSVAMPFGLLGSVALTPQGPVGVELSLPDPPPKTSKPVHSYEMQRELLDYALDAYGRTRRLSSIVMSWLPES